MLWHKKKSKDHPRQAKVAQGVPDRLRPQIFLIFRHYKGGRLSAKRTGRLYPRRNPWYSLSEDESTSGQMVLSGVPWKKSPVTPPGIDPGTFRLIAQCLNHYATPDPYVMIYYGQNHILCERETWSVTLREEITGWGCSGKGCQRRYLGLIGSDRKLRKSSNKKLHDWYSSDTNQVIK